MIFCCDNTGVHELTGEIEWLNFGLFDPRDGRWHIDIYVGF